jgi:hypothetical protein
MSRAAVRYAQELTHLPEELLALRLYSYGHRPVSSEKRRTLEDEGAMLTFLGLGSRGEAQRTLDSSWIIVAPRPGTRTCWHGWRPRPTASWSTGEDARHKLYVSPSADRVGDALGVIAHALAGAPGVSALKVGADVHGVCRPDKLVVHFDRLDDLHAAATKLRTRLDGYPAHGVPFSAPITPDGLLSWATDPPPAVVTADRTSWRRWVTERLAEYLIAARTKPMGQLEPWQFALGRLRLDGVDTRTWIADPGIWSTNQEIG